jgi:hypothetical protein
MAFDDRDRSRFSSRGWTFPVIELEQLLGRKVDVASEPNSR